MCFRTVLLRRLAEMANVCLSLGGGHVFVTSSVRRQESIKGFYVLLAVRVISKNLTALEK